MPTILRQALYAVNVNTVFAETVRLLFSSLQISIDDNGNSECTPRCRRRIKMRCKRGTDFLGRAMANICFLRSHAARTESFCSRRADRSEGSCNIVCSIETERSAQVWARWSSPFPTWHDGGTRQLVGTRNPRARINSCFARLSTIWKIYPIHTTVRRDYLSTRRVGRITSVYVATYRSDACLHS